MADLTAGQILTASTFNSKTRRCIARASRLTASALWVGAPTPMPVLRLDDKPILAGRTYRITWKAHGISTAGTDEVRGIITYTTDGSTPTGSSATLPGSAASTTVSGTAASGRADHLVGVTDYTPVADQTLSVLLGVTRSVGAAGTVGLTANGTSLLIAIYIDDMGDDPGNTGTNL